MTGARKDVGCGDAEDLDQVLDAVVAASRVLVGIATRSLHATTEDVTLPQCRALATMAQLGPSSLVALAEALRVNPSTAKRMCDRLITKGLVDRVTQGGGVCLTPTRAGRDIVRRITEARRLELRQVVDQLNEAERADLVRCMEAFRRAGGEADEREWALGWWE